MFIHSVILFPILIEYTNKNLTKMVTPVHVEVLQRLLKESNYDEEETKFLVDGFTHGFDIGYEVPEIRTDTANNIPFQKGVGDKFELWEKIMKETKLGRYAGPFKDIPYENYMQSPIGLVPKAGNQTQLIFHLSYQFKSGLGLLNENTPKEKCSVKYHDLDYAVRTSFICRNSRNYRGKLYYAKTDLKSAFRILGLHPKCFKWLLMKAQHPVTGEVFYFIDKCLPFGSSISCSHFQHFSNALKHLLEFKVGRSMIVTNYLDDFLFVSTSKEDCDFLVKSFLQLCEDLGVPVVMEKTEWGCTKMVFFGILLDGECMLLTIPEEKRRKALSWIVKMLDSKKTTKKELEKLAGLLNFLNHAVFPGACLHLKDVR